MQHYYYTDGPMGNQGNGIYHLIGLGVFIVFLVVIGLIVARVVKHHGGPWLQHQHRDPLEIAKERYAKGEIDKEQFEQIKKDLQ